MYVELKNFKENYWNPGIQDRRAVEEFAECESRETVRRLEMELSAIAGGNYSASVLETLLGKDRPQRFGSWEDWGKLMLQWLRRANAGL